MTCSKILVSTALILAACGLLCVSAQAEKPTRTVVVTPTTQPAPTVLATVGEVKITSDQVEKPLKALPPNVPANRIPELRQKVLGSMIMAELVHNFLEAQKAPFEQKAHEEFMAELAMQAKQRGMSVDEFTKMLNLDERRIRDRVRLTSLAEKETADEKVKALIEAHPNWFNGTKVTASHILIKCEPTAATAEQKAAIAKLEKIAGEIKAGKITFEKAAEANSECPSGKRAQGDLGEFAFGRMVAPFSMTAFDMKVGDVSGVFRTSFGFHIIKLTKRSEGAEKPGLLAQQSAKNCLFSMLESRMFEQALTSCPIVINKTN